ncbi:hypothetical protein [Geodermatophilus sp. URMC 64]
MDGGDELPVVGQRGVQRGKDGGHGVGERSRGERLQLGTAHVGDRRARTPRDRQPKAAAFALRRRWRREEG